MGRSSRSFKLREWPSSQALARSHGGDSPSTPSSAAALSAASPVWLSLFIWASAFAIAGFSGYDLGAVCYNCINKMLINRLFSEYILPGPMHMHLIYERNRSFSQSSIEPSGLWNPPKSNGWWPCLQKKSNKIILAGVKPRFIQVFCTGGLFQLHICVSNAVAVAWMLNASLVVPYFQESLVWKDPSKFQDLYDVDHFISSLKKEVRIVQQLPSKYQWSTPEYYDRRCLERPNCFYFVPKHATMEWYFVNVLPILESYGIAVLDRFHHKLAFEGLPIEATRLRCKTNFHALKFVRSITKLAQKLVHRMQQNITLQNLALLANQSKSATNDTNSGRVLEKGYNGHFFGLHLRFEKDMIAHSACYYGGGQAEQRGLESYRRKYFRNPVPKAQFSPTFLRRNGSCPLTPEEVGLLLSGLGFTNRTLIYVAGKDIYGGKARMRPLLEMFPFMQTKRTLASKEELEQVMPFSHKLAAVDFMVLLESDAFLSNSAGNFPNILTGQRTFWGPKKSIHPDKAALFTLFSNQSMGWEEFSLAVRVAHKDRLGAPNPRKERFSVFRYPAPDCMCQH